MNPVTVHMLLNRAPVKYGWDFLALAQILMRGGVATGSRLSLAQRLRCLKFYIDADGIRRLWAASPRSGTRWSQLALALALDLADGGDGEYVYEGDTFYPTRGNICQRLDWRVPTGEWEAMHARASGPVLGEQIYYESRLPYFRLRAVPIKSMKTVIVTRSIPAILVSMYLKEAKAETLAGVTLDDDNSFDWDEALKKILAFYNSWGEVMRWHPGVVHYKYEDMKTDPVGSHMEILDFWGLKVPEECMAEGLRRASKKEMLKRIHVEDQDRLVRVSTLGSNERRIISASRMEYIVARLDRDLVHDFGYEYNATTPYYTAYD